jgi:aminodeoxyfutalosine deaminase
VRRGLPIVLSSDDPAMFETTVSDEYRHAHRMGLNRVELVRLAEASFHHAFLSDAERAALLSEFRSRISALGLV